MSSNDSLAGHLERGQIAEKIAMDYLTSQGFQVRDRNFECPLGEIDLIVEQEGVIHFVEVKGRWSARAGGPLEQLTPGKMRRIGRAAQYYLQSRPELEGRRLYLSVLGVDGRQDPVQVDWVPDAFQLPTG